MSMLQKLWYGNIKPNEDKIITDEEKELVFLKFLLTKKKETLCEYLFPLGSGIRILLSRTKGPPDLSPIFVQQ